MTNKFVFDMGGVITKHYYLQGFYNELFPQINYNDFKYFMYCSDASIQAYKGLITIEEFFAELAIKCGIKYDYEKILKAYLAYKGGIHRKTLLIIEYLKEQNNDIYLLSNLNEADHLYLEQNIDMNLFTKQFLSYEMHKVKPDKEIYEEVINDLGTNDFYFFDNSKSNIEAAKEMGIKAFETTGHDINETMKLIYKK